MKKIFFISLALIAFINKAHAQDQVHWEEVAIAVESGSAGIVYQLVDDFYSSIEIPDGASVTLAGVVNASQWNEATHILNFIGSAEALSELRDLRSGETYSAYNRNITQVAEIVSITQGKTLIRIPGEQGQDVYSSQEWSFYVEDQREFGEAFVELMDSIETDGYVSLGQYTAGESGRTHYIYANYPNYVSQLNTGPKNASEQAAFEKFFKRVNPISTYRGSVTTQNGGYWD